MRSVVRRLVGVLTMLGLVLMLAPAAAASPASAAWEQQVQLWDSSPASVVFQVQKPAVAVILSVAGQSPTALASVLEGSVRITPAGGATTKLPVAILGQGQVGNTAWVLAGENTARLSGSGRITLYMRMADGIYWNPLSTQYTVAPGAVAAVPAPTAAQQAFVQRLNAMRAAAGVPPVGVSPALTAAAAAHAGFVAEHPALYGQSSVSMHTEPGNLTGETGLWPNNRDAAFGSRFGGGAEVMSRGGAAHPLADLVNETVFHRSILLNPRVLTAGAADVSGVFVMDLAEGLAAPPMQVRWPAAGAGGVPTTMWGEYPSPLSGFAGAGYPAGTPITWQCYACVSRRVPVAQAVYNVQASLSAAGQVVPTYLLTDQNWRDTNPTYSGVALGAALALLPRQPLAGGTTYTVRVTASVYGQALVSSCWAFSTGGPVAQTAGCTASTTTAPSVTQGPPINTGGSGSTSPPTSTGGSSGTTTAPPTNTGGSSGSVVAGSLRGAFLGAPAWAWAHAALPGAARAGLRVLMAEGATNLTFGDVARDAPWAASAVARLTAAGVVDGVGPGVFDPNGHLTREQVAVMLARLAPNGAPSPASGAVQVPSWAQAGVNQAVASGWLQASADMGGQVSRAAAIRELMRFAGWRALARAYEAQGGRWPAGLTTHAAWNVQTKADLLWAAHIGLLRGIGGRVAGNQPLTRAQFAVLLMRLDRLAQ